MIDAKIEGAAKLELNGTGDRLIARVSGASTLNAFDYKVSETDVTTHSASMARVYASDHLIVKSHGASNVRYRGNANVEIEKSGSSSVRKE